MSDVRESRVIGSRKADAGGGRVGWRVECGSGRTFHRRSDHGISLESAVWHVKLSRVSRGHAIGQLPK